MFSKRIIWLALLSVYPLWPEASFAKSSVKAQGMTIGAEHFVPAQDEPFSSTRIDTKAVKTGDDVRAAEAQAVGAAIAKPESESKPVQGEAEQIKSFLSPGVAPVVTIASELSPVTSTKSNQTNEVVKLVQPVLPVQTVQQIGVSRIEPSGLEKSQIDQAGGPLRVNPNPTRQELDDRAKYWEARGRTDLSAKLQNQVKLDEPKPVTTLRPVVAVPVAATVERARSVSRTIAAEAEPIGLDAAKSTSQELDDGAQYWEARGRSDLASQLRQKLQTMEPRHAVVARNMSPVVLTDLEKTKINQYVAKSALEEAVLKNPGSTQARLDLAKIYQGAGEYNKARGMIEGVLAGNPDLPAALYASAQLYAEQRLWRETLYTLEKISPVSRNDEMGKLQKTAWAHVQIDQADALVRQGNNREAEVLLRQVAVEFAVNDKQRVQPETPELWKSVTKQESKLKTRISGQ